MTRQILLAAWLALGAGAAELAAQEHPEHRAQPSEAAVEEFIARAREATAHYRDRTAAISDGYRRLGPDFPGMGQHWISPSLMAEGQFDVTRPQVLSYAQISGRPTLVGVAYAVPLAPGESPPDFPSRAHAWHDHVGAIDEESVLLHQTVSGHGEHEGLRLAMLHAWIWLPNPDGLFATDNWSLPLARLGLTGGVNTPPAAAKLLSLPVGGDTYYGLLFRALAEPTGEEESAAQALLTRYRGRVESWLAARDTATAQLSAVELSELTALWTGLWTEISSAVRPEAAARLRPLLSPH